MTSAAYYDHDLDAASELGLTHLSAVDCPRRLVRKHCRNWYSEVCWCRNNLNDHGATWRDHVGRCVMGQPCPFEADKLAVVIEAAHRDGLRVVLGQAVWAPPGEASGCIGIRFYAKGLPR